MIEYRKNIVGEVLFVLFVIGLIIGGQYLYSKTINNKNDNNIHKNKIEYRIDKNKDYFYYTNEAVISEKAEIYYHDIVLNIIGQEKLTESLNKENNIYKSNIKYISDANILSNEVVNYNNDNIYSLYYREYKMFSYNKYRSLAIFDYSYDCFDLSTIKNVKTFVFDITNGKLVSNDQILKEHDTNIDDIKELITINLTSKQTTVNGIEVININETINNFNNYGLYINDAGKLVVTYLVKSSQIDYNDTIVIE